MKTKLLSMACAVIALSLTGCIYMGDPDNNYSSQYSSWEWEYSDYDRDYRDYRDRPRHDRGHYKPRPPHGGDYHGRPPRPGDHDTKPRPPHQSGNWNHGNKPNKPDGPHKPPPPPPNTGHQGGWSGPKVINLGDFSKHNKPRPAPNSGLDSNAAGSN